MSLLESWSRNAAGVAFALTVLGLPLSVSAQACFGDGVVCGADIQTISSATPSEFSMLTAGSNTFVGLGGYASTNGYIYRWQPNEHCIGNGTSCGTPLQTFTPTADYIGSISLVEMGTDILAITTEDMDVTVGGRVYKWRAAQQCFGNNNTCGTPLQTITLSVGGAPNVIRWQTFTDDGVQYLLGTLYLGSARLYRWQSAQQCFGNGTTCNSTVQIISSATLNTGNTNTNGMLVFRIGSELFLVDGKHTSNAGSYLFVWQRAQQCFGDGTTCAAYVQNFPFAHVTAWSFLEADGQYFLIDAGWTYEAGHMFVWQPAQRCFGNGITCNTSLREGVPGFSSSYKQLTINGAPFVVGIGQSGLAIFRWRTGERCFGNDITCASGYNGNYIALSPGFTGSGYGFVTEGPNIYVLSGGGAGVQMLMSPPTAPAVTAATTVRTSATTTIAATAEDASGDTIRYGFDWDNNFTVDEWVPATGYVPSGSTVTIDHSWSTSGTKTYNVTAQDVTGVYSTAWTTKTITVTNPPPPVLLTASTYTYRQGDAAVTLTWSSSGANYCSGVNFGTSNMSTAGSRTVTPSATTTYEVRCTGSSGTGSSSKTVAYAANQSPMAPTIDGPTVVTSGTTYTYTFTATDPESDTIRYGVDWDNSGSIDAWIPASGYVTSGTTQSALRSWTGARTFKARAQDSRGVNSSWSSYSISCAAVNICDTDGNIHNNCTGAIVQTCPYGCSGSSCTVPPPVFNPDAAAGTTGHLTARPSLIRPGDTTRLYWDVSNVSSCTVSGDNGDSWTGASSGGGGKQTRSLTGRAVYTLACTAFTGASPATISETVTVRVTPAFKEL